MSVGTYLQEQHVPFETLLHPPAFCAQKRAKYLHISGKQVAKSVLLVGPTGLLLAILPASRQIDLSLVSAELGGETRVARADEIEHVFRDCEWGVVPPFGMLYGLETLLEESLPSAAWLIFEGNSCMEAIRMLCSDFEKLERPRRFAFAR